jgi:uncharacterized repeat protein (TIGR03803 family)
MPRTKSQTLVLIPVLAFAFLTSAVPAFAAGEEKVLHEFKGTDGAQPGASLVFDAAGNLYGTTTYGGSYTAGCGGFGCGTVFELVRGADGKWTETVLHSFTGGRDGSLPFNSLVFDAAGNLYGTTSDGGAIGSGCADYGGYGCGTVFQLIPGANGLWTEKVLHSFGAGEDGGNPTGVILDAAGHLYGTTIAGGAHGGAGTVFRLEPEIDGQWLETVLHSFSYEGDRGYNPWAGVAFDAAGNLYGTTSGGGTNHGHCISDGCGTVFQLTPGTDGKWTQKVLHNFGYGNDGFLPYASLSIDAAGNLYGTTCFGGAHESGTVFRLARGPNGEWTEKVLHSFGYGKDGGNVVGNLIIDAAGNLYGATPGGGVDGYGIVYRLAPGSDDHWTETLLHSFHDNDRDGIYPDAGVVFDAGGNLYGTTLAGGPQGYYGYGTVFEIMP